MNQSCKEEATVFYIKSIYVYVAGPTEREEKRMREREEGRGGKGRGGERKEEKGL